MTGWVGCGGGHIYALAVLARVCSRTATDIAPVLSSVLHSSRIEQNVLLVAQSERPTSFPRPSTPNRPDPMFNQTGSSLRLGVHLSQPVTNVVYTFDRHAYPTPSARRPPSRPPHILSGSLQHSCSRTRDTFQGRRRPAGSELSGDMVH